MDLSREIQLENGKYTIVIDERGIVSHALRHGERWRELAGDHMISGLVGLLNDCAPLPKGEEGMRYYLNTLSILYIDNLCKDEGDKAEGDYSEDSLVFVRMLIEAESEEEANAIARFNAASYFGDFRESKLSSSGWGFECLDGRALVHSRGVREISKNTYEELKTEISITTKAMAEGFNL